VRSPSFLRSIHPVTLEDLPGKARDEAFVQVCPSLNYKFLWVHASNSGYRNDYKNFLKSFHHVQEELPDTLVVDHVYNWRRALKRGSPFVRTVLAHYSINSSHGGGYEASRTKSRIGRFGRDHTMDTVVLLKICGIPSPRKGQPLTSEMRSHIQGVARKFGLNIEQMEQEIKDLMDVASFEPHDHK